MIQEDDYLILASKGQPPGAKRGHDAEDKARDHPGHQCLRPRAAGGRIIAENKATRGGSLMPRAGLGTRTTALGLSYSRVPNSEKVAVGYFSPYFLDKNPPPAAPHELFLRVGGSNAGSLWCLVFLRRAKQPRI